MQTLKKVEKLVLLKAQNLSSAFGIAWALVDIQGEILLCNGTIAGFHPKKLGFSINRFKTKVNHLYLSLEPVEGIFDIATLTEKIEASSLSKCTILSSTLNHCQSKYWIDWQKTWQGQIYHLNVENCFNRSAEALARAYNNTYKPWLTAISTTGRHGENVSLEDAMILSGAKTSVCPLIKECRAVFHTQLQSQFLAKLPVENNMEEEVEYYCIDDYRNISKLLQYCRREGVYNAVALCDINCLSFLIDNNLVDEAFHFTLHKTPRPARSPQKPHPVFEGDHWLVCETETAIQYQRTRLLRNAHFTKANVLGHGLH